MADIVANPAIPYSESIPGGIFPNKTIYIQGFVPPNCDRFNVNLQNGVGTSQPEIAFHFNPRFEGKNYVVCNTKTDQRWGAEERHHDNFPFEQGKNFELIILCELNEFKVAVNGQHFLEFKHRIVDLQRVTAVLIAGNVKIYSVRYDPPSAPSPYQGSFGATGLQHGTIVTVKLIVNPSPNRFAINMTGDHYGEQHDDIAFHFNPRFPERVIVRNSKRSQKWGPEERDGAFPFAPGGTHEVIILCMRKCYLVQVDGHHVVRYDHRHDVQTVKTITVAGDIVIREITIE